MLNSHMQESVNNTIQHENTHITLIARDPHTLYAYWEVPDKKRLAFIFDFGEELWNKSFFVLKVTNISKNESLFLQVNDYTDNWYIPSVDANATFLAEIGRSVSQHFFISMGSSNYTTTPSESVSSTTSAQFVDFRRVRDRQIDSANETKIQAPNFDFYTNKLFGTSSESLIR